MEIPDQTAAPLFATDTIKDQMIRQYLVEHEVEDILHTWIDDWGMGRDELTDLALSLSLCPLHFIDYAICFDDENLTCLWIRVIHPGHDT